MAVTKTIVKNTHQEVVVKVAGTAGNTSIALATDLLNSAQALDGSTQTATIIGLGWTGLLSSAITVTRGGATLFTVAGENSGYFDLDGQNLPPETINATSDVTVAIAGAEAQVWVKFRKVGGYKSKSGEYPQYGAYEDETRVGGYTNVSGSPDYTG